MRPEIEGRQACSSRILPMRGPALADPDEITASVCGPSALPALVIGPALQMASLLRQVGRVSD
jgi:hypothetical protein